MHIPDTRKADGARDYFTPFLPYFRDRRAVLDIGSGQGHFLSLLREKNIPASGIEADKHLCSLLRENGLNVTCADLFEFLSAAEPRRYDAVMASHIVEHFLPEAVERMFKLLHAAMQPGAPLVVLTPNIAHLRRAAGDFWHDPSHVRPYPISALNNLGERTGFRKTASGEHSAKRYGWSRRFLHGLRNRLIGRHWGGSDVFAVLTREP